MSCIKLTTPEFNNTALLCVSEFRLDDMKTSAMSSQDSDNTSAMYQMNFIGLQLGAMQTTGLKVALGTDRLHILSVVYPLR